MENLLSGMTPIFFLVGLAFVAMLVSFISDEQPLDGKTNTVDPLERFKDGLEYQIPVEMRDNVFYYSGMKVKDTFERFEEGKHVCSIRWDGQFFVYRIGLVEWKVPFIIKPFDIYFEGLE